MTERQRTNRPGSSEEQSEETSAIDLNEVRHVADRLMVNAEASLRRLGLSNANDYLNATRQSGGQ